MNDGAKMIIKNPLKIFIALGHRGKLDWISDETYLKIAFRICLGRKLNILRPQTYNEKLQWLKLYDRKPEYINMVDKYEAKLIAGKIIGEQYIIPTLGIWDSFDEIDFASLPEQFVLKCTHDSGSIFICKSKNEFDMKNVRKKLNKCLKNNFFGAYREWPYKYVKPRIIAEQYMEDNATHELRDYKFLTFNGKVKLMYIVSERMRIGRPRLDFFDRDFNHLPFTRKGHSNADIPPERPHNFELMAELAEYLSKGIPQLRVDFYETNGRVYFGEFTFFPASGMKSFEPSVWDKKLGDWLELPKEHEENM